MCFFNGYTGINVNCFYTWINWELVRWWMDFRLLNLHQLSILIKSYNGWFSCIDGIFDIVVKLILSIFIKRLDFVVFGFVFLILHFLYYIPVLGAFERLGHFSDDYDRLFLEQPVLTQLPKQRSVLLLIFTAWYLFRLWYLVDLWLVGELAFCLDVDKVQVRFFATRRCPISTIFTLWLANIPEPLQVWLLLLLIQLEGAELDVWVFQCLSALTLDIKHGYSSFLGTRNGHTNVATVAIDAGWCGFHTLISIVVFGLVVMALIWLYQS